MRFEYDPTDHNALVIAGVAVSLGDFSIRFSDGVLRTQYPLSRTAAESDSLRGQVDLGRSDLVGSHSGDDTCHARCFAKGPRQARAGHA